ncbi:Uncharacterised protein [Vibrio cholerae]|nr:Uncharacterised protein [Vibrio cholerae]
MAHITMWRRYFSGEAVPALTINHPYSLLISCRLRVTPSLSPNDLELQLGGK